MVFFTPLNPSGENSDEETQDESLTVPRKVHHRNVWKGKQDAVHWVNLAHAKSHVVVVQCSCGRRACASNLHVQSHISERRTNSK